jgi:hypothetical protein
VCLLRRYKDGLFSHRLSVDKQIKGLDGFFAVFPICYWTVQREASELQSCGSTVTNTVLVSDIIFQWVYLLLV